jgi:cysteinyl-tRNA synthetase
MKFPEIEIKLPKKIYDRLPDRSSFAKSVGRVWQIAKSKGADIKAKYELAKNGSGEPKPKSEESIRKAKPAYEERTSEKTNYYREEKTETEYPPYESDRGKTYERETADGEVPEEVWELKEERDEARAQKNWQVVDKLNNEIKKYGYTVEDFGTRSTLRKTSSSN